MRQLMFILVISVTQALPSSAYAAEPLAWLPADINAVARINVAEIYKSPIAQKEGWLKKSNESFVNQETFVPPGTKQIFVAADLDLSTDMIANRKYSVVIPDSPMSLEKLSAWVPLEIEKFSGKTLASFGSSGYVADAGDGCWLVTPSTSRQAMTKWLKAGPTSAGAQTSEYLKSVLTNRENTAQVLLAIDLHDNFSETGITERMKSTDWFKGGTNLDAVVKVLESVKGIMITMNAAEERTAKATVEFGKDAAPLKPVLEKLADYVVQQVGASSDDIKGWKWSIQGHVVTGGGSVSTGTARRLISLLDPPSVTEAIAAEASAKPSEADKIKNGSLKYMKSLQVLMKDVRSSYENTENTASIFNDRYARKIDELATLNVDKAILDYANNVSRSLRYQAQTEKMNKISSGTRRVETYGAGNSYNVGPYGSYYSGPIGPGPGLAIQAQANQSTKSVRFSEWSKIDDGLTQLRRAMTDKYQVEF